MRRGVSHRRRGRESGREKDVRLAQLSGVFVAKVNGSKNSVQPTVRLASPTMSISFHSSLTLSHPLLFHRLRLLSS